MLLGVNPETRALLLGYPSVSNIPTQSLGDSCLRAFTITRDTFKSLFQHGSSAQAWTYSFSASLSIAFCVSSLWRGGSCQPKQTPCISTTPPMRNFHCLERSLSPAFSLHLSDRIPFPGFKLPRSETKERERKKLNSFIHPHVFFAHLTLLSTLWDLGRSLYSLLFPGLYILKYF